MGGEEWEVARPTLNLQPTYSTYAAVYTLPTLLLYLLFSNLRPTCYSLFTTDYQLRSTFARIRHLRMLEWCMLGRAQQRPRRF